MDVAMDKYRVTITKHYVVEARNKCEAELVADSTATHFAQKIHAVKIKDDVTVEEFNNEVKRLFTEEKEAMNELIDLSEK